MSDPMDSAVLKFTTRYGNRYGVRADGAIIRADRACNPSGQWLFLGIKHVKRNEFIPFAQLTPERIRGLEMRDKKRDPQWTVRDLDHGTMRTWGNTQVHGIVSFEAEGVYKT